MVDVAREAGVSVSAVSRALAGGKGVSERTRLKIQQLSEQLGYVVSPEASKLAGGRTGRVGLITPTINEWFYSAVIAGVAAELTAAGIDVLLYPLDDSDERRRFFEDLPARRKVDAVINIAFPITEEEWERLDAMGVHAVVAGIIKPGRPSVGIDDELAARHAVNHLLGLGHRRIAMISTVDPEGTHYSADESRERGYRSALAAAGIDVDEELVVPVPWGIDGGAQGMDKLLTLSRLPTAVFAFSDEVAYGALQSLRRAGLRVPQDMSIIGIDDHPMAETMDLTTVHQTPFEQGVLAGRLSLGLINGESPDQQIVCPASLVVRRSTCPPSAIAMALPA
ncbi:LacI family DNA-binding transcriptional regulator [Arthrobacter sp. MI7-26]|uniref:LacI family DNA-binding transcriptional regulator n=1 Tax=Arthrobacter sp. MI7-26 TaxID=2993653 RepID=UPI0022496C28|nr:LacI family DNA-binding transcriptional regulator [Arthrobacter sp. MI7-26]